MGLTVQHGRGQPRDTQKTEMDRSQDPGPGGGPEAVMGSAAPKDQAEGTMYTKGCWEQSGCILQQKGAPLGAGPAVREGVGGWEAGRTGSQVF